MRLRFKLSAISKRVAPDREWAFRRLGRIKLAQRTRGRVARVRKRGETGSNPSGVQFCKGAERQVDLPAHFDDSRDRLVTHRLELARERRDRQDVLGDVLPNDSISPSGAADEPSIFVGKGNREAVDFRFDHKSDGSLSKSGSSDRVARPAVPIAKFFGAPRVRQRQHGLAVADLREPSRWCCSYPRCRRIGRDQIGVRRLECL